MASADLFSFGTSRRKPMKDQVSPYKIALLIMIDEHCKMMTKRKKGELVDEYYTDAAECTLMITMLQLVQVCRLT